MLTAHAADAPQPRTGQRLTEALDVARQTARVVSIPMRTKFRGVTQREALLFEGPEGWAEWSPFNEYPDDEAAVWLAAALDYSNVATPPPLRQQIGINATLPAVAPDQIEATLAPFGQFRTVKIKVAEAGQKMADDLARIRKVHQLYPEARIRLDANGGYSPGNAMQLAYRLLHDDIKLEYFEQPVATVAELATLRQTLQAKGVLVAADESVRKAEDPLAVAHADAADLLVIKAAPLGGVRRALQIVDQAGLPAVISSALETSVGIGMGLHLAASIPQLEYDCGLGTASLLVDDVTEQPLIPVDGYLAVQRAKVSPAKLDQLAAEPERTQWWLDRLERCARLL